MALSAERQLEIIISAVDHASKTFSSISRAASGMGSGFIGAGRSAASMAGSIAKHAAYAGAAVAGAATVAGAAAGKLGQSMLTSAGNIEQQRIALTTLTGSAEEANKVINQIIEDAKKTPFEFAGLVKGNAMLISADVSAEKARQTILDLGDAVAATGGGQEEFSRIVSNLQQIKNVGQASAVDIKQFGFAGINVNKLLAESMGKSREEISNMVSDGKIGFKEVSAALRMAADEGGMFEGAMEDQSKSLFGLWSTLKDTISLSFAEIAEESGMFDGAKAALTSLIDLFENNKENIIGFAKGIGDAINSTIIPALKSVGETIASVFGGLAEYVNQLNPFYEDIKGIDETLGALEEKSKAFGDQLQTAMESGADQDIIDSLSAQKDAVDKTIGKYKEQRDELSKNGSVFTQVKEKWDNFKQSIADSKAVQLLEKAFNFLADQFNKHVIPALEDLRAKFEENRPQIELAAAVIGTILVTALYVAIRVIGIAIKIIGWLVDGFGILVNTILGVIDKWYSFKAAVLTVIADVIWAVMNLKNKIIETISSINLFDIGANMMLGLAQGIASKIPFVGQSARSAVEQAVQEAKAAGEIKSPSRVFMRIGAYMTEGMIVGLKSHKEELQKTIQDIISPDDLEKSVEEKIQDAKNSSIVEYFEDAVSSVKEVLQQLYDVGPTKKTIFDKLGDSMQNIKDYKSTIKDLKKEIKEVRRDAVAEIAKINAEFKATLPAAMKSIYSEYKSTIKDMSAALGSDIANVLIEAEEKIAEYKDDLFEKQKDQAEELADLQEEQATKRAEIEDMLALNLTDRQKAALKEQLAELEATQADEMSELKSKHAEELAEIKEKISEENALLQKHAQDYKAYAAAIKEARRLGSLDEIQILKEQFTTEKKEQYAAAQEKIKELYKERDASIASAKAERDGRVAEIKTEIKQTKSLLEEEIDNRKKLFKKATAEIKDQLKEILKYSKNFIGELTDGFQNIPSSLADAFSQFSEDFATAAKAVGGKKLAKKAKKFAKANNGGVVTSTGVMGFSDGGVVPGPMSLHDTVPAMLEPGEIVFNPRKGQGISQKVEVYFMNPTVRSENDLSAITRVVEDTLNRKLKLNNLGV